MMEITNIIALSTAIVTFILGIIVKKYTKIENKKIPIQQLAIAILSSLITIICIATNVIDMGYFGAISLCFSSVFVTQGAYDTVKAALEAIQKIVEK